MRATLTLSRDFAMHAAFRKLAHIAIVAGACLLTGLAASAIGLWLCWPVQ
jgi:hypothetical protein